MLRWNGFLGAREVWRSIVLRCRARRDGHGLANYHQMMTREWKNLKPWKQTGFVPMQFNRFITYPTCFFHSRFPFEAFGTGPEDGRLIWICFYDIEGKPMSAISVGTGLAIAGGIGAAGSIVSGVLGSSAAKSAADRLRQRPFSTATTCSIRTIRPRSRSRSSSTTPRKRTSPRGCNPAPARSMRSGAT
jgi:hypothetical protein